MNAGIVDIVTETSGEHVPNAYFDAIGLTDEWIRRRTGVGARWWMDESEPLDEVAARVCAPLVARHGEGRISALLVVSSSAGGAVPGIAQRVATKAGLPNDILAFDMSAACSGFIYGLISGLSLCDAGDGAGVIVCCVEAMSRMLDKTDRNTGPLFGDGAAAVLLQPRPEFRKHRWHAGSDGAGADLMRGQIGKGIVLDGIRVYHRAVRTMTETAKILRENDVEPSIVIGHQANSRILQRVRDEADIGSAVFVDCVENFGNTSAASIPLALGASLAEGTIPAAGRALLVAYGAGEAWGGVMVDYDLTGTPHG
ncbi:3-oxoacyl-[acyl-carrier-protein] synthase-3 [Mycobacterium sp. BK558]|uniref:3-oxoacyl-[acyl-carrier-protein] synthase 3 n=1 Tax=Mycolicibacterium chlorophenolicum TaxID=37916 RepID=A0A0J6Y3H6_9MYCO|nr:3-oxoacyl-[acyl-carrier-protein] synthase III C-terminal domain-containing protein [Mycolicibacterium chlorophenolicum]KMO67716.1 3-oxoacyl-[acyl-carrier-protein] synthase 3 [Mycolicibacterium chlorophenolicum]MBI5338688.1 ketoacyl-ACP synthase III [Mycolicibacterium rufum]RZT25647.1 3-oxoacyl-[acyl-carrier-protein] synthase-3 [Mycobacterium sp. BK558]